MLTLNATLEAIRTIVREEVRPLVEQSEERVSKKMDAVLASNDKIARLLTKKDHEQAATRGTLDRHEQTLENHTHRLKRLEAHVGVKA